MYIYVYIYVHIYMYIYIYIHTHTHIYMMFFIQGWVMSHLSESCHVWMSHKPLKTIYIQTHIYDVLHTWMSHVTLWLSHVTFEWVMPHINESCHVWISHGTYESVTQINESCHTWVRYVTFDWVTNLCKPDIYTHIYMMCFIHGWVMSHLSDLCHTRMSHEPLKTIYISDSIYKTRVSCSVRYRVENTYYHKPPKTIYIRINSVWFVAHLCVKRLYI